MLTSFFLKRPQQSLPYLLWGLMVFLWAILSLSSGQPASDITDETDRDSLHYRYPHQSRNQGEGFFSRIYRYHSQESGQDPAQDQNEITHPRLKQQPLPFHPSQPEFPNIPIAVHLPANDGSNITEEEVEVELTSIWDLGDNRFWRMECDGQDRLPKRYEILKQHAEQHASSRIKYFFALDLYQVRDLLPRLMGTIVHAMKMLGPEKCALSIVEGRSEDGTYAVLLALKEKLETIGVEVYLEQSDINPKAEGVDRIGALSALRNMALRPLIEGYPSIKANETTQDEKTKNPTDADKNEDASLKVKRIVIDPTDTINSNNKHASGTYASEGIINDPTPQIPLYNNETVIIFINDIALCTDDIYELLFQHYFQSAHQTCAMDWVHGGNLFYDSWVSRSMSGDLFFEVPQDVSFSFAENMFWDHPLTKEKFKNKQPFQVYSCWGGMVTLSSAPFIEDGIRVRNSTKEECYAGEPVTLAKDLWATGYGKILTVPSVNVGYNNPDGKRIKKRRGWVKDNVQVDKTEEEWKGTEPIQWKEKPPGQVKCMPGWGVVSWTEP